MSNQTEELMASIGTVLPFPDWKVENRYTEPGLGFSIGDACPVSLRAALLSRSPGRVQDMLITLSENCFEVMMFRKWEPGLQNALNTGILIADMTGCRDIVAFRKERDMLIPGEAGVPVLYLVNEELMGRAGGSLLSEELMVWPARSKQTMLYQVQRTIRLFSGVTLRSEEGAKGLVFKDLIVDREKMTLHQGHTPVHLTKTEFSLLIHLLESGGAVCTREELMSKIWDTDFMGGSNVVDVHVKSLRKKLNDHAGAPRYIATVRGVGYRLAD
ncbi:winged helix family transcriptional regulator [Paenibacillus campinasensis]|uniref:Winged helix family transcriptional regulator n=1 Tax=Paenibacillus campinasensis TaxID=66347 RepID=A0ABW9T8R9_9BACL|nr:winged helix-turn-helix domain-containing protein [Paenibacillus campinasensis]MUG67581.1 winged helix family transcriptional regulator [Paenibacillus campinasensis]